jgi:large subunit ribosomal protein L24
MKVKKNDQVKMLSGKDKGKTGKVSQVFPEDNKLIVEGLNLIKKHVRPRKEGEKGQRVEIPRKVAISSVAVICPKCQKPTRIGFRIIKGKKARICKKCKGEV